MALSQFSYCFPIATLIQIFILIFVRRNKIDHRYLYALVSLFIVQNAIYSGTIFIPKSNIISIEILIRSFYVASFLSTACFLSYAITISTVKRRNFTRQIENGVWAVAVCGAALSVFTDEIISGFRPISFTVTALQGDLFWVRQIQGVLAVVTACAVLANEWRNLQDRNAKRRYLLILVTYLSFALSMLVASIMMRYGIEISFAMNFPISTTFCLGLIIYANFKYQLPINAQKSQPMLAEMPDRDQLNHIFTQFTEGKYTYNEASEKLDYLLLTHSYKKHNGNMMKAAKGIGLARSTFYKKVQKYNLR